MKKQQLREQYLNRRMNLSEEALQSMSQFIADKFFRHILLQSIETVHVFIPIRNRNEVNTWPIINRLIGFGKTLVISKTDTESNLMVNYFHQPDMPMKKNRWGIYEPVEGTICPDDKIDCVLLPLLVADKKGHRIGYGGGYYDRFLVNCRKDTLKVGLSFFPPVEAIEDVHPGDVVMDYLLTPEDFLAF